MKIKYSEDIRFSSVLLKAFTVSYWTAAYTISLNTCTDSVPPAELRASWAGPAKALSACGSVATMTSGPSGIQEKYVQTQLQRNN